MIVVCISSGDEWCLYPCILMSHEYYEDTLFFIPKIMNQHYDIVLI